MDTMGLSMLIPLFIWIGTIMFIVVMGTRLVRAVERIAEALEKE